MSWTGALALNGFLGLGGYLASRGVWRREAGLPRGLAAAVLAWTWATLGVLVLGPFGSLTYGGLLGWSLAGLAVALACWRPWAARSVPAGDPRSGVPAAPVEPSGSRWDWLATIALALVLWATLPLGLNSLLGPVKVVSDGPIYHLYFAARWWAAERLFLVASPFGENAATYFPAGGDVWFTWLMVSWGGDRLAKVGQAPFLLLAALTVFALARRLGVSVPAAVLAVGWFVTSTPLLLFSFEPNVDTIFVAGYLLAAYFFLRYALGDEGGPALALGALAAGGAWGTKPTGIVFIPPLLALAAVAVCLRPTTTPGRRGAHLALLGLLPMVMAGFWLARNAALTGNPLYPLQVEAFGRVWLPGWYGPEAMRLSPYYLPWTDWRALGDTLLAVLDPRMAPVWLLAVAGAWALGQRDRRPEDRWVGLLAALAVLNVALYWLAIPYRTQQRFMLQAVGLAAIPLGRLLDRHRGLRLLALGLLALHVLTPQGWPWIGPDGTLPWDLDPRIPNVIGAPVRGLPATADELHAALSGSQERWWALVALAGGLGAMLAAWTWGRCLRHPRPGRCAQAVGVTILVAVGLGAVILPRGVDPRLLFFPPFPDYFRAWIELDHRAGPAGARIAYAGTNIPYYLLGRGLRNEVRYVNIDEHRDWLLHDYHRDAQRRGHQPTWPNPRPGWDRLRPDFDAWLANLRAEGIQMLVVARVNPAEGSHNVADPQGFPIERQWAEAHPELFVPLYGVEEGDPQMRIFGVRRQ